MTEVQRATHPGGGSVTLSKVLTRRKDHGGDHHHRDGDEDASPPLHTSDPRDDDPRSRGERRSRRDMPVEDLSAAAAASPVKRTKSGVQIHPGSPPPLTASPGRDNDDRGSLTSTEAPWVARWLAGRGTPRHGATDDHHGPDTHGNGIHPPRRAGSTSPTISRTSSTTLPTEPLGSVFKRSHVQRIFPMFCVPLFRSHAPQGFLSFCSSFLFSSSTLHFPFSPSLLSLRSPVPCTFKSRKKL